MRFIILYSLFISNVKAQIRTSPENFALTYFIDSIMPLLPQADSTIYIQKKTEVGIPWGTFYGLISRQHLTQRDSIDLKQFNDSIIKTPYYWSSNSKMVFRPWNQRIMNMKSRITVRYLNSLDKFQYHSDNRIKKLDNGYYISVSNSVYVDNLTISTVSLIPLRADSQDPPTYEGQARSYYIIYDRKSDACRYYEIEGYPKPDPILWR